MKIPKDVIAVVAKKQKANSSVKMDISYDVDNDALALLVKEMDREKEAAHG